MYWFVQKKQRKQIEFNHSKSRWLAMNSMTFIEKRNLKEWRTEQDGLTWQCWHLRRKNFEILSWVII